MTSRLSPIWLVVVGILSVQFGAGIAKSLFDEVEPTTIVWLRLVTSAWCWRWSRDRRCAAARRGTGWWWSGSAPAWD